LSIYWKSAKNLSGTIKAIFDGVERILSAPNPAEKLRTYVDTIADVVDFRLSDKHMSGHSIGEFMPSPALARVHGRSG
jgi:hypothetical protein